LRVITLTTASSHPPLGEKKTATPSSCTLFTVDFCGTTPRPGFSRAKSAAAVIEPIKVKATAVLTIRMSEDYSGKPPLFAVVPKAHIFCQKK